MNTTIDTIQDGVVVSLAYTLTAEGETVESASAEDPLDYLHGAENIVPGLEAALLGKKVGDRFNITLAPEDAYGEYDPEEVETIPLTDIPDFDNLEVGMVVMMEDDEGYLFDAIVSEIKDGNVVLDFNPQLAGKTVTYDIEVLALRAAEEEELEAGQPYGYMDDFDEDYDDHDHDHED